MSRRVYRCRIGFNVSAAPNPLTMIDTTETETDTGTRLLYHEKYGTVGALSQFDSLMTTHRDPKVLHPIELLIQRAEAQHRAVQRKLRTVVTLADAVQDYEDTWKLPPPLGFDKWYVHSHGTVLIFRFELAKSTGAIHVPSLIPESHMTYRNFLSIPSYMIHERVAKLSTADWPYLLTISAGEEGETKLNVSNPNDPLRRSFWGCP